MHPYPSFGLGNDQFIFACDGGYASNPSMDALEVHYVERLIAEAKLLELQTAADRIALERAVRELYQDDEAADKVDRALFARYVWNGLHLPRRT